MSDKRVSRREFLGLLASAAASSALAACAPSAPQVVKETVEVEKPVEVVVQETVVVAGTPEVVEKVVTATPGPAPAPAEPVELVYFRHGNVLAEELQQKILYGWNAEHPETTIRMESIPFGDMDIKVATAFAAGNDPDFMSIGDWVVPQYVEAGWLSEPDWMVWGVGSQGEFLDLFEPGTQDGLMWQGNCWGYPYEQSLGTTAYRIDHLAELGLEDNPPETWEDWVEVGQEVRQLDAQGNLMSVWLDSWNFGASAFSWLYKPQILMQQLGGGFINEDATETLVTNEGSIRALQFFSDTLHEWKLWDPQFTSPEPGGTWVNGLQTYSVKHTVYGVEAVKTAWDFVWDRDYKLQHWPTFRDGKKLNNFYTWLYVVTDSSEHKQEAWDVIEYMTRWPERTLQWIDVCGAYHFRKGLFDLPEIQEKTYIPFFLDEYTWSVPYARTPNYGEFSTTINLHMDRLLSFPPDTVEEVAADLEKELNAILQG